MSAVEDLARLLDKSPTGEEPDIPPLEDIPGFKNRDENRAFLRAKQPSKGQSSSRSQSSELTDESILENRGKMLTKIGELMFNSKGDCADDSDGEEEVRTLKPCGAVEENVKIAFCGFKPGFLSKQQHGSGGPDLTGECDGIIEVKVKKAKRHRRAAPVVLDQETAREVNFKPFALPQNQTPEQHLHAMAVATGLTDKLLEEVQRDPELYSLLEDPRFGNVLLEFQFHPENALRRYSGDERIMGAMRKFSAIFRKHFE